MDALTRGDLYYVAAEQYAHSRKTLDFGTPADCFHALLRLSVESIGSDLPLLAHWDLVYAAAKERHPGRWRRATRN
jgi:hypothetical protein